MQFKTVTPPLYAVDSATVTINGYPVKDATPAEANAVLEAHNLAIKMTDKAIDKLTVALKTPDDALKRLFNVSGTNPC